MKKGWLTALFLVFAQTGIAQEKLTEHTYSLPGEAPLGKGRLQDVAWLVGSWQGTAFGNQFEATWSPASAGSMVGTWKLFDDEQGVSFYELLLLKEEGDGLVLLVKHFSAEFIAWEDKSEFVTFRLVSVEENAVHFSGLSFYQGDENQFDGYIVMRHEDGSQTEHHIAYTRVQAGPGD